MGTGESGMKRLKKPSKKATLLVVILLIGLVIGYVVGNSRSDNSKDSKSSSQLESSKAATFRTKIVSLGNEYVALLNRATNTSMDGTKDAEASKKALYNNGKDISSAFGGVYGGKFEADFSKTWNAHLDQYFKYSIALKKHDNSNMGSAEHDLNFTFTDDVAKSLHDSNPKLGQATASSLFTDQVATNLGMIKAHSNGKYDSELTQLQEATEHMTYVSNVIVDATLKQYPSKF